MNLYLTADCVGVQTGGGLVTRHESEALRGLGPCEVWGREQLGQSASSPGAGPDPWCWDAAAKSYLLGRDWGAGGGGFPRLCHVYAGTFGETVAALRFRGRCKVAYTAAAHDVAASRQAHLDAGLPYDYPHLTEPALLDYYLRGYREADVLVCPSRHSEAVMRGFGCTQRIEIIPHGVDLPAGPPAPLPERFTVGYLGAYSGDKSVKTLLEAWKILGYKDATLILAGRDSTSPWVQHCCRVYGGGHVYLMGWVNQLSDFYERISLYVQPSMTEGFGIEVLESMAFGRLSICSTGAGAADIALETFPAGDAQTLASKIDYCKTNREELITKGKEARRVASLYTWDRIRGEYQRLWKNLLGMADRGTGESESCRI